MSLLRELFGPSKAEIWQTLSEEIAADFQDGGWFGTDKVVAKHRQWTITLDTHKEGKRRYTRLRAPYINRDGFRFRLYRSNFFNDIGKKVGLEDDVEIGIPDFDYDFIIQGNDHYKLWKLFANERVRYLIEGQPAINLQIVPANHWFWDDDYPENVDMIEFKVRDTITDMRQLEKLFNLFAELLDHLCTIGAAYEDDPTLKNYYL